MTWNVLADAYLRPELYPHLPDPLALPGSRGARIAEIIATSAADVVCLQEVDGTLPERLGAVLAGWDLLWCPKGAGRVDGCLTALRPGVALAAHSRLEYADGAPPSGHVAQSVIVADGAQVVEILNTHLRWALPGSEDHIGVRQVTELVAAAGPEAVIVGDLNDRPGGPVRDVLAAAGFIEVHPGVPSALVDGDACAIDTISVRGRAAAPGPPTFAVDPAVPYPDGNCPSDHVPLLATIGT